MEDVLKTIVAHKRLEVAQQKTIISEAQLFSRALETTRPKISMRRSLETSATGIIAEFKRRSPSKGWISQQAEAAKVISGYRDGGAAACSVLTDTEFFGGSLRDLVAARAAIANTLPLLRKEFVIDPYQIFQARAAGADAVLLIAACLSPQQCAELAAAANETGLEVLLEIHSEDELSHLNSNVDMLGVNNRNLGTFHTDTNNSFRLAQAMQSHAVASDKRPLLVSESGITDTVTITRLRAVGFQGFLIGEAFMKSADPAAALSNFIKQIR